MRPENKYNVIYVVHHIVHIMSKQNEYSVGKYAQRRYWLMQTL